MKKYRIEPNRPDPVFFSFREFISVIEKTGKKWLTIGERSGIIFNVAANSNGTIMTT